MAKLKSKIASKYSSKPKRKLVLGGPYTDVEKELYLNDNVTYQASTLPTTMLQNQFDAQEQEKAKRMTAIYGDQMARQLDYLQDQNAASEKRKQEEKAQQDAAAEANKQAVNQQVTQTGVKVGKQIAKDAKAGLFNTVTPVASNYYSPTWAPVTPAPIAPVGPAPIMIDPAMQTATSTTGDLFANAPTVGQNMATTTTTSGFGQTAAAVGKSVGSAALIAAPQIAGQIAYNQLNKADDREMKREGKSQYYDDTDYSRKEYNAQLLKSAGKGATIGGTIASAIPIPGISTGIGMAAGAIIGTGVGAIKAQHQRRMTKEEDERGVKIGNKRFGKKLLFGEENVYDENLDPTVIEKRNREAQLKAMTDTANAMDNATLSSMTQYDTNTGFNVAKYGGSIKKLKGGVAKPIGKGAIEYVGKKHEQGGIDLPGNVEVEGGETEQNNYVFSATLKLPNGATYAQAHKNLIKSGATGEEIHQLALSQEAAAGRNPNEIKGMKFAKYGGPLKYVKGGLIDPPAEIKGDQGYWYIYDLAKQFGDPFPEVTAAQWAIESGWGKSLTGKNNAFGQTTKGKGTTLDTPKDPGGGSKTFKDYESVEDSVKEHVEQWSRVYKNAKTPEEALYLLQKNGGEGRYAQGFPTKEYPQGDWKAYIDNTLSIINKRPVSDKPTSTKSNSESTSQQKIVQIPGAYGSMVDAYWDPQSGGYVMTEQGKKAQEGIVRIKQEQDENVLNWGMGALTGIYGGAKSLGMFAAKKAGQYIDDIMSEEEAVNNASQNASGARASGTNTGVTRSTGIPYRDQNTNTILSNFKPFGRETGLATEGQWMADAGAVTDEALGFPRASGNMGVGPYRPENGYINITGRTIKPTVDPRVKLNFGDIAKLPIQYFNSEKFSEQLEEERKKAAQKQKEEVIPEEEKTTTEETAATGTGTADTSKLQDKYTLPKISAGPFNRPEYPTRSAEETTPPKKKYDLSELPADKKDYTGLLNFVPGIVAGMTPNFKTVAPSLVQGSAGSPGAIGRVTFNRETDRQLLAENARTAAAMQQAAGMQGGPGALAALGRAQLLKSEADLKATGMVQAKNAEINAREAAANASISAQNMANVNQYEARRLQQAAMNANILNTTNQYNTDLKNKEKYMKYATGVEVAQNAVENYLGYKKDQDTLQRDKDVASAMDAYHTLERKDVERKILEASTDKKSKYYGTDPVTARAMARQYIEEAYPDQRKLGGPKYVSRLGNLVNKRNKRF
jgi:hypothetical protein